MQDLVSLFINFLIVGINLGTLYALFAVGLTLLFGVLRVVNAAHGMLFLIGGYLSVLTSLVLSPNPFIGLVLAMTVCFIIGILLYGTLIRPLRLRTGKLDPRDRETVLVTTFGLSMFLENMLLIITGGRTWISTEFFTQIFIIGSVRIASQRVLISLVAVFVTAFLWIFLSKTKSGLAIRAVSQDADTARALGVNLGIIYSLTFGISVMLSGAAGALISSVLALYPTLGFGLSLRGISIILLGGLGSVSGSVVAGLIMGISESMAIWLIGAAWADIVPFTIMLLVFVIRPSGLFGRWIEQARE